MVIRFLCNAGISIEYNDKMLLIDMPNGVSEPFHVLSDEIWDAICEHRRPYSPVCGFFFTHDHPDHLSKTRLSQYLDTQGDVPVFIPDKNTTHGRIRIDEFEIEYQRIEHAPMPQAPPHVVVKISVGNKCIYISGDAALNCDEHYKFLGREKVDAAVWTPMYLSRAETRELLLEVAVRNFVNHMPSKASGPEIWRKCEKNIQRYYSELKDVTIIDRYPMEIVI